MKIAYLITAYNNYNHLKRLISALNDSNVVFFIHIDKKSKMPNNLNEFGNVVFIERTKIWWGGWSHVDAIIRLIRNAISYRFDYYILLSGSDYPIRPNSVLYKILSIGDEYITISKERIHKLERIKYYYFDGFDRRDIHSIKTVFFLFLERLSRLFFQKKSYPFKQIYDGGTWWALSHDCLLFVMDQVDNNKDYIKFFKTCCIPEEGFFQTIIGNSPFYGKCKSNLTYQDWSTNPAPAWINKSHIELFKRQLEFNVGYGNFVPFFTRKFNDESENILELIEKELRNSDGQ
jgi:hypothetical protein